MTDHYAPPGQKEPKQPKEIPAKVRAQVRKRSGGICEVKSDVCTTKAAQQHHIQRRSQGRLHDPLNIKDCCLDCHSLIHANVARAKAEGWLK